MNQPVVLITGALTGIGHAIAIAIAIAIAFAFAFAFARDGARLGRDGQCSP